MSCDCAYMSCADLDNRVKGVLAPRQIYIYLNTDKIKLAKIGRASHLSLPPTLEKYTFDSCINFEN